jgi:nitroreductase
MEKNILFCEDLGLSTCWLGATFDRSGFSKKLNLAENEGLPAVTPVGYAQKKRRVKDRAMRMFVGSDSRIEYEKLFFDNDFSRPLETVKSGKYSECLEMVRIGPSASNKQPWRVVKEEGKNIFHFYLEPTPAYTWPEAQHLDMGIAMCHFEFACMELGLGGRWVESVPHLEAGGREYVVTWKACLNA